MTITRNKILYDFDNPRLGKLLMNENQISVIVFSENDIKDIKEDIIGYVLCNDNSLSLENDGFIYGNIEWLIEDYQEYEWSHVMCEIDESRGSIKHLDNIVYKRKSIKENQMINILEN